MLVPPSSDSRATSSLRIDQQSATTSALVTKWVKPTNIVTAVITGVTNATAESLNRLAKLEARRAYGFRDPQTSAAASASPAPAAPGDRRPAPPAQHGVTKRKHNHG